MNDTKYCQTVMESPERCYDSIVQKCTLRLSICRHRDDASRNISGPTACGPERSHDLPEGRPSVIQVSVLKGDALSRDFAGYAAVLVGVFREKALLASEKVALHCCATRIVEFSSMPFRLPVHRGYVAEVCGRVIGPMYPKRGGGKPVERVAGTGEVIYAHSDLARTIGDRFVVPFEQCDEVLVILSALHDPAILVTGEHGLEVVESRFLGRPASSIR
jgi:hypothetical protein